MSGECPNLMEDHMQTLMRANDSRWASRSFLGCADATRLVLALFARTVKRYLCTEDAIADRYSGCGWTDEIERRTLGDVLNRYHRSI